MKIPRYPDFEVTYLTTNRFAYLANGFTEREGAEEDLTGYMKAVPMEDLIPVSEISGYSYHAILPFSTLAEGKE